MHKGRVPPVPYRKFVRQVALGQAIFAIALSPLLPLTAVAQSVSPAPSTSPTGSPGTSTFTPPATSSNIILPTDVLPLNAAQDRIPFGENLLLRINQYLPSRFYFSSSIETSLRFETNPFQFPRKSRLVRQLPQGQAYQQLSFNQKYALQQIINHTDSQDNVFRILPNVSGGWTLTPRTRLFGNYFMIRDQLAKNVQLNTMIHSYAWGIQQDIPISSRANLQAEMQFRELNQWHQQSVFDFLPGLTLSYIANPRTVLFVNALLQMRGKKYFQAPTKELDPFYTWGLLHTRGGWTFAASSTFVQNFREPFGKNATIPESNYAFISDFEIARRLFRNIPGLQAFVRAEPIFNFHSHERPGLAGTDFRLFYGLRMAVAKPALTNTINNIMEQLRQQEGDPPGGPSKPSASLPNNVIAGLQQPIHGLNDGDGPTEAVRVPVGAGSAEAAANTIASAEGDGGVDGAAPDVVAGVGGATAEPVVVDLTKADWKPLIATLPDEGEYTLESIHEEVDALVAESTGGAGYDATSSRIGVVAAKPVEKPRVEVAKVDVAKASGWEKLAAAAGAVRITEPRMDEVAPLVAQGAAESTALAYEHTAQHTSRLAQKFEAKPVVAQKPASPQIAALGHEAEKSAQRFAHVEAPTPVIAMGHESHKSTQRFAHIDTTEPAIALAHEEHGRGDGEAAWTSARQRSESRPSVAMGHESEKSAQRFAHVEAPKPVIAFTHESEKSAQRFAHVDAPKPVIAFSHESEKSAQRFAHVETPKPMALAHEEHGTGDGEAAWTSARLRSESRPSIALTHESEKSAQRFTHVDAPKPVIAFTHESEKSAQRFAHVDAPKPVIAFTHESEKSAQRFAHVDAPKPVIVLTHESEKSAQRFTHVDAPKPTIALTHEEHGRGDGEAAWTSARQRSESRPSIAMGHESEKSAQRFPHVDAPKPIIAFTHEAEKSAQRFPHVEQINIAKIDWSPLAHTASSIHFNSATLDAGTVDDTIAIAQSTTSALGAAHNDARVAELVHLAPPPEPTPRAPMVAANHAVPKPMLGHEQLLPGSEHGALPAPERITVAAAPATPKQISLAAAIPPVPMTPTAAVSRSSSKPAAPAVSPSLVPSSQLASNLIAPQPLTGGMSQNPMPAAPRVAVGQANAAGGPAAPAPTAIASGVDAAPELARVAMVPAAPHVVAAPPSPIKAEAPQAVPSDLLAALPAPVTAPTVSKLDGANWDGLVAAALSPKPMLSMQYMGGLRASIDRAANDTARVLDYVALHKFEQRRQIASRPPKAAPAQEQRAVLMVPMQAATPPRSIAGDRPGEARDAAVFATEKENDPTKVHGWHTQPSKSSVTTMKIVPPLPTVLIREGEKKDPFKEAGLDIKMPVMLSLPH